MPSVKYAISAYVADGTTTDYLITWDYLDEDHIAVYVDGTSNADPTASHTFVQLNSTTLRITDNLGNAIVSGSEIEIRRETPLTNRAITFADGSALLAADLNKNSDYLLYSMQEVLDTVDAAAQDGALAAQVATEAFRDEAEGFMNTTAGYLATVQSDATDADNHRIAAAASEAAAATSEANAATSEANAAGSAAASAASAGASASQASAAAGSASQANSSKLSAQSAASSAAASETAAAASANAASLSEAAAAVSEANAAASFDSFDDRYLGAKASAPTVDNDGNALLTGALYWNSTSDTMYVWNGASWDTFNSTTGISDGASSTVVTIDANGSVGIGVNSPAARLDVSGGAIVASDGGGYALFAPKPSTSVFGTDWDRFEIRVDPSSQTTYLGNTNGGTGLARDLALLAGSGERMRITSGGHIFVNTATGTPSGTLADGAVEISANALNNGIKTKVNSPQYVCYASEGKTTSDDVNFYYHSMMLNESGSIVGSIVTRHSGVTYTTASDRRLKTDIKPLADATDKLMAMNPVTHKWIADPEADAVVGFIAQEMKQIVPEAVSGTPDGEEMMSMDYGRITPVLVAALQDAHKKIEALENRINALENN